ncbi:lipopolysaccharide biosynthesis protein [Kitasatospora sp. NPDC001540]|uniref:lipopolysaccharide biosynthesis protein n=1 Tax=Kitasatospora sp. NPDC001540 TaxID=3364014 RepID=UPI0036B8C81E
MARHGRPAGAPPAVPAARGGGGHRRARHAKKADQVYRSSFFVLAATATTAALGFVFWVVVARYYTPSEVGLATSLISATTLISYLSMFGLNSTLVRFPADESARNGQLTLAVVLVAGISCVVGAGYLLGLPLYGRKLMFVRDDPVAIAAFVLFCACASVNQLTKSIFVGSRMPQTNVLVDGLLQGAAKLALPVALAGFGVFGVVGSTGGGYVVAALVALAVMHRRLGWRPDFRTRGTRLREQFRFSLASYTSSLLNLLPQLVLPLIVLHHLGAAAAGYYYVAFQIAALLNAVSFSVGEALFAEASNDPSRFFVLLRRTAAIIAAVQVPAALAVALGSGLLLRLFGAGYAGQARSLLVAYAVGALAVALNTWVAFALKLTGQLRNLVLGNVVYVLVTVGTALRTAPRGLVWMGWSWGAGNLAAGLVGLVGLFWWRYRQRNPRRAAAGPPAAGSAAPTAEAVR